MNKIGSLFDQLAVVVSRMDNTSWAVLSVVTVVAGYMLLKGNAIKGA